MCHLKPASPDECQRNPILRHRRPWKRSRADRCCGSDHRRHIPASDLQLRRLRNLIHWNEATPGDPNSQPLTSYLYSGESFDFNINQQYLRARFYDATTGRFNRLDPFFGNSSDPQSFHKYGYVHGDPIHGIDPTGKVLEQLMAQAQQIGFITPEILVVPRRDAG